MKANSFLVALLLSSTVLLSSLPPLAQAALPQAIDGEALPTLAPMLERVTPAVVNISTQGRVVAQSPLLSDPFFRRFFNIPEHRQERRTQGLGSGVIIDARKGYILTNHHVIDKAEDITIRLNDGRSFEAELIGSDPDADVAVIRIDADGLTEVKMADSSRLRVGDFVVAIGNPFGLGQTVTSGIVSALGRSGLGIEAYEDFIQTDASINPGNSGGALVNLRGELVGINTAILGPNGGNIGIGFAIPINMADQITEQLVEFGEVRRGRLGVAAQDLTPELAKAFDTRQKQGVVVAQVDSGSPAEKAGLKVGDVVVSVNGREVRSSADMRNVIGLLRIGAEVDMEVVRGRRTLRLKAVVAEPQLQTIEGKRLSRHLDGAVLGDIEEGSRYYGQIEGVLVLQVERGSAAARAGLRPDDIILSVNKQHVASVDEVQRAIKRGGRGLLLNIQRGNSALFILLQ